MIELEGLILRSLSGFYNVKTNSGILVCKPRGIFRKGSNKPVVGDKVVVEHSDEADVISKILPRKNFFLRPQLANLDSIIFVVSTCDPKINYLITDKLIAIAEHKGIEPALIITKTDMAPAKEISDIYNLAGIKNISIDYSSGDLGEVYALIEGKVSAFCGNSGVGKTTLLNHLFPDLNLETAKTSSKLGRGKHTTRTVEFFRANEGFVADTPGFSTVDMLRYGDIPKEELAGCFREFEPYLNCKFNTCSHTYEPDCGVKEAVKNGLISKRRYDNYLNIYNELKDRKSWQ